MTITNSTLGDLLAGGWTLMAECDGLDCGHGTPLDIAALIERFGAGHIVINDMRIKHRLRCRKCAHKGCSLRLIPYSVSSGGTLYNAGTTPEY